MRTRPSESSVAVWSSRALAIEPVGLKVPADAWVGTREGEAGGDCGVVGEALADVGLDTARTCVDSPEPLTAVIQ
jgi:hypothetical protein